LTAIFSGWERRNPLLCFINTYAVKSQSRTMQPRIYTYKITFEEVSYYYYGSKKERYFNEEYWGSPVTNKWCWELYTPKKQILEFFDYTDEGYEECIKVENRLIKPVLNDPWCLNERCNNLYSLKVLRECGKKTGEKYGSINGLKTKENKTGIFSLTKEERSKNAKINGRIGGKISSNQKWKCLETGFITNPGNLTKYQKTRNIDTSKRVRIS
jgi:hypothetical protein